MPFGNTKNKSIIKNGIILDFFIRFLSFMIEVVVCVGRLLQCRFEVGSYSVIAQLLLTTNDITP